MELIYTDGRNQDFISLCRLLDDYLNEIAGGEEKRAQYIPYNTLGDIHNVVLAYNKGALAGCATFRAYEEGVAEVKRVFIKKEYRGKGIAKQMMACLEKNARIKGFKKLILETGKPLVEAISLYLGIGFVVTDNYGPYQCMPESICMQKEI